MPKTINVHQLQAEISKILKDAEAGESFEVLRYSKPVAFLLSWKDYQKLISGVECRQCVTELREFIKSKNE